MKLRIKGNTIRLRLTRTEVAEIAAGREVREVTEFSLTSQLIYCLSVSTGKKVAAEFKHNCLLISVPLSLSQNWAESDDVGLEAEQGHLKIIIEKDFACLSPRGEEDSDTFQHPMSGQIKC